MILLWGMSGDEPLAAVAEAVAARDVVLIDQRDPLVHRIDIAAGTLRHRSGVVELAAINGAYLRPHDETRVRAAAAPVARRHAGALTAALLHWADHAPARIVNRPAAAAIGTSKPAQAMPIRRVGFAHPETLVTNDRERAIAFLDRHRRVVYKSTSAVRSIVSILDRRDTARLDRLACCPVLLQEYVDGQDVRVHVTGERVHACSIRSAAVDYRYGLQPARMRPFRLPADVAQRCVCLTQDLGLSLAGIDLRCTPHGRWHCLEVNTSPAFTCFPGAEAVARGIAELLEAR